MAAEGPAKRASARTRFRERLASVRRLVSIRLLLVLSMASVVGGLAEAGVLVLVVRVATALAAEQNEVDVALGPISLPGLSLQALLMAALGLALLKLVSQQLAAFLTAKAASGALLRIRTSTFGAFQEAEWSKQVVERQGRLQDLLTTHAVEAARLVMVGSLAIGGLFNFATLLVSAFVVNLVAAAVIMVCVVGLFFVFRPFVARSRRHSREWGVENNNFASLVSENVGLSLETTTYHAQAAVRAEVDAAAGRATSRYFRVQYMSRSLSGIYQSAALAIVIVGLAVVASVDALDASSLGAVVLLLVRALSYSQTFQVAYHQVNELAPFVEESQGELDRYVAARRTSGTTPLERVDSLEFRSLWFGYDPAEPVLHGVDLEVRRGEAIGIVGPSGSGKSTVLQLLLRLRQPDAGTYLINGQAAESFALGDWYRRVALLPQESRLLRGTVSDNIRFYRPLSQGDVEAASRAAHLHDHVMALPQGYDTVVGTEGNAMSGGQRQRLSLARALAGRPDVLVLDEPTSALDLHSESIVLDTLQELKGSVTLFIVAHRISTLGVCDRVAVFNAGVLQAVGPASELVSSNDFFAEAVRLSRL